MAAHTSPLPESKKPARSASSAARLPIQQFLENCWQEHKNLNDGDIASYIPELLAAKPEHFGVAIASIDGFVHKIGDTDIEFTIQSVSKAFVFALALDLVGNEEVSKIIGVEPSGEAFNSIRLGPDNRPFNPMVNAGAIACTGLIFNTNPSEVFDIIAAKLSQFAGRALTVDEDVFESERSTGDRNRAIAWLLRNYEKLPQDVDAVVNAYFRQCAILVSASDLSVMGATLANGGRNPVTNEVVISTETCARVLSMMSSCGMYDYSGEWIYRVGLPAKSGVGGGIVATLPAQLGLGVYSPLLDPLGNSVRGLRVCENLSSHFDLHVLKSQGDVASKVAADYNLQDIHSSRDRRREDLSILERNGNEVRVLELAGALNFVSADYMSRRLNHDETTTILVLDFRKVAEISKAAAKLIAATVANFEHANARVAISGLVKNGPQEERLKDCLAEEGVSKLRLLPTLNDALTWAEDQIIFSYGGSFGIGKDTELAEQALLQGMDATQLQLIRDYGSLSEFGPGDCVIESGQPSDSVYFLLNGTVSVKLDGGTTLATLDSGTCFGEFALVSPEEPRSANIISDTKTRCLKLQVGDLPNMTLAGHSLMEPMLRNLVVLTVDRLRGANARIEAQSR